MKELPRSRRIAELEIAGAVANLAGHLALSEGRKPLEATFGRHSWRRSFPETEEPRHRKRATAHTMQSAAASPIGSVR